MKLQSGNGYVMQFDNGGVEVYRDGKALYVNRRPLYAFIKTALSITEFYDAPYDTIETDGERVIAGGCLKSPTSAELAMQDTYEVVGRSFKVSRTTTVLRNVSDYGFASKLSFVLAASEDIMEYDYFAPANWYRQNEYSKPYSMGYDKSCEYYWRNEVNYTLPLFAMQNRASGEMIMLSRWAGDVTMRDNTFVQSEHVVDRKFTIGSIGFSKPRSETLNYLYYGFPLRKEIGTRRQGLYIDYVYPGTDGELPRTDGGYNVDYMMRTKTMTRVYHPMEEGFSHSFSIAVDFGCYDGYVKFIHNNTRQANDLYGEFGYAQPGLSHEGGHFASQVFASHYHWLPWVTYVEVDPVSRLYDTFGAYDIAGADQLDPRERETRNRIYDDYWQQA